MIAGKPVPSVLKAVLWMAVALLSFTAMAVAVRELAGEMHAFQILFIRSTIGALIIVAALFATGWQQLGTRRLAVHGLRNVVHFIGQVLWIFGIQLLPLVTVFAIEFTTPLWAAVLAVLFLGERMNRGRWVALVCGFCGILVILQPGYTEPDPALFVMIVCAVFFGLSVTFTKSLTRTDHALTIMFFMTVMQTGLGLVASVFVWTPVALWHWPWLTVVAVTGLSAHYSMVRAFGHADATIVVPMDFLRLPLIALVGFSIYGESLEPATVVGATLILSGIYYSITRENRTARAALATAGDDRNNGPPTAKGTGR
jgi:drug/metabolite transporter (DMT)-like permease